MHSGAGLEPRKKASASQLTSSGRARPNQRSYYVLPFAWDTELDLHHQSKWEKLVRYHLGQVCLRVLSPLVTVSPGWGAGVILCTPTVLEGKAETPGAPLLSLRFTVNKWPHQGLNAHDPCKGCHFLLQCMRVKSESEVAQSCPTPSDPMDCSLPGSSVHGIFQARVLEWVAIAFSLM